MNQGISRKHKDVRGVDEESADRLHADLRLKDGDGEKETRMSEPLRIVEISDYL